MDFTKALLEFSTAVSLKDESTFLKYISHDLDFYAELPGNIILNSAEEFLESQKTWFQSH